MSWYYIKGAKTIGPCSVDDLLELFQLNHLSCADLVRHKQSGWKCAYEFTEIYKFLEKQDLDTSVKKKWTIMSFDKGELHRRTQKGPFSSEDVRLALLTGDVHYQDYIWQKGMRQWYPIVLIDEFNIKKTTPYFRQKPQENKGLLYPAKPYLIRSQPRPQVELPPAEAQGEDLLS